MLEDATNLGVLALLIALGAVNAALSVALLRWRDAREPTGQSGPNATAATDDETVRCPTCGEANEPHYAFCRACVSRLPGDTGVPGGPAPTPDRVG